MFGRLSEIDEELGNLPEQLGPLEKQVERGREIVAQSEQSNPMNHPLSTLLQRAERSQVENLGWLVGEQTTDPTAVATYVAQFMLAALGRPHIAGDLAPYESSLVDLVRLPGGTALPSGAREAALVRKLFVEPWLAVDAKTRAHIMESLVREVTENARWLPEPRPNIFDEEGRSIVGEGAGALGAYFCSAALLTLGLHTMHLTPPTRTFSVISGTLAMFTDENHHPKFSTAFHGAAGTNERGRALMVVAYVYFIRSIQMGQFEQEHRKIRDVLSNAEVMLDQGKKRVERLRTARSEIVLQLAGTLSLVVTLVAMLGLIVYSTLFEEKPPGASPSSSDTATPSTPAEQAPELAPTDAALSTPPP